MARRLPAAIVRARAMAMAGETATARERARVMPRARTRATASRQQQQSRTSAAAAAAIPRTSINQVEQLVCDVQKTTTNYDWEKGSTPFKMPMSYYSLF